MGKEGREEREGEGGVEEGEGEEVERTGRGVEGVLRERYVELQRQLVGARACARVYTCA